MLSQDAMRGFDALIGEVDAAGEGQKKTPWMSQAWHRRKTWLRWLKELRDYVADLHTMRTALEIELRRLGVEVDRKGHYVNAALTFDRFSAANRRRCEAPDGFRHALESWSTSDWFLAALGELGEAANIAKKLNRCRDGIPGNKETEAVLREKLRRELGDTFVYLDLLAQALGFTIGEAGVEVFNAKSDEIGSPERL